LKLQDIVRLAKKSGRSEILDGRQKSARSRHCGLDPQSIITIAMIFHLAAPGPPIVRSLE